MIKESQAVAIIPARGGSKRIPRKNIKSFHGKPLVAYSIENALKSGIFDRVVVSTDDEEIAKIAQSYQAEVPFLRPESIADAYSGTQSVLDHSILFLNSKGQVFDFVCTLYATAPLLDIKYLLQGLELLKASDALCAFSCTSMPFPIQRTFQITANGRCKMFYPEYFASRSQDLIEAYQDAGQFYWTKQLRQKVSNEQNIFSQESIPVVIPRHLVQDIDTLEDWRRAEYMYEILERDRVC